MPIRLDLRQADITAWVIHELAHDADIHSLVEHSKIYARAQRHTYRANWLGELYQRNHMAMDGEDFIERGWDEVLAVLTKVEIALKNPDMQADPCIATGEGWIAEEAFSTALYCFLLYPDNPMEAIRRGANSSGDSDSITCIAGAFAGAYHGIDAWQSSWLKRIEYKQELQSLCDSLTALHSA